jgi:cytochrome P450
LALGRRRSRTDRCQGALSLQRDLTFVNVVRRLLGGNETTASLLTAVRDRATEEPAVSPAGRGAGTRRCSRWKRVLGLFRTTTCPVEKHGKVIPAGAKVMLHLGAAHAIRADSTRRTFSLDP